MRNDDDHGLDSVEWARLLVASAARCDAQADALWLYASDCDRWGLGTDAADARKKTCAMRVRAMMDRALSAGLRAGRADPA